MKRLIQALALSAAALILMNPASARELRVLTSWDNSYPPVQVVLEPMMRDIEAALEGQFTTRVLGPETIPPFEQFQPVARGLFEMLYTNGGYHYDSVGLGTAIDTFEADHSLIRDSGIWDLIDQEYQKEGLKLLAVIHNPGFNFVMKQPLAEGDAFDGLRIRAIPLYHRVVQELGGSPVVLPMPEIYPALERGVVEGAAWPTLGVYDARWFEVAGYVTRPAFGRGVQLFMVNVDVWESLGQEVQDTILQVARDWEERSAELMAEVDTQEENQLVEAGMEITEFSSEQMDRVRRAFYEGGIAMAAQRNPDAVEQLKILVEDAGIEP